MKILTYKIQGSTAVYHPETDSVEQQLSLGEVILEDPSEEAIELAKQTGYNGEYTLTDDGRPEPETADGVLNALLGVNV